MWMIASSTWHSLRSHHLPRGSFLAISPPDVKIIKHIWLEFLGDSSFSVFFFMLFPSLPPVFISIFIFCSHIRYSQIVPKFAQVLRYREWAPENSQYYCWTLRYFPRILQLSQDIFHQFHWSVRTSGESEWIQVIEDAGALNYWFHR